MPSLHRKPRVLCVGHDVRLRELCAAVLREEGFEVLEASVDDAFDALEDPPFDAVVFGHLVSGDDKRAISMASKSLQPEPLVVGIFETTMPDGLVPVKPRALLRALRSLVPEKASAAHGSQPR